MTVSMSGVSAVHAVFRKCFEGGKTEVPRNKGEEPGIQLFSVINAMLIEIRLDEFPRGEGGGANASP